MIIFMSTIAESTVIQFLTSDPVIGLAKPVVITGVVGAMLYSQVKPRLEASDKVQV